jgi:hypothetical protein
VALRDWIPGTNEPPLQTANRLRSEALEDPESVDVERLVELFLKAGDPAVCRASANGIATVAQRAPPTLSDVVPQLLEATTVVDGVGAKQRGDLAGAVEAVARAEPEAVVSHSDIVVESLEKELEADERPGNDVRLFEDKTAALARTAGLTQVERAEPILEKLARHHHHEVSDGKHCTSCSGRDRPGAASLSTASNGENGAQSSGVALAVLRPELLVAALATAVRSLRVPCVAPHTDHLLEDAILGCFERSHVRPFSRPGLRVTNRSPHECPRLSATHAPDG